MNTSIWDGAATITQTDNAAALMTGLRIESDATLTVPANKWLTVSGTLSNQGTASSLVVESGGSLLQSTANVPATVKRYIADWSGGATKGWHLLSSPLSAQPFQTTFVTNPPDATQDFYLWDEQQGLWINSKLGTGPYTFNTAAFGSAFTPGKGYLCAYQTGSTKQFTGGFLNTSDLVMPCTKQGPGNWSDAGWNLLGNPYPCALTWSTGWTLNNINALAQIWNEANASYSVITAGAIIPAMQGFMVQATAPGSVTIPVSARTHSSTAWYKSTSDPLIKLVAHNPSDETAQESVLTFNEQATAGYDPDFDSYFLTGYAPPFYSMAGGEPFAYNTLPVLNKTVTVPFHFVRTEGNYYYIEAESIENILYDVFLTDLKLNVTQSLVKNPRYDFTSNSGDTPARFLLSFGDAITGTGDEPAGPAIYSYNNNLYVNRAGQARVEIFDLTGKRLNSMEINNPGLFTATLTLPTSYYIVRLTTGTKVLVERIFIKN